MGEELKPDTRRPIFVGAAVQNSDGFAFEVINPSKDVKGITVVEVKASPANIFLDKKVIYTNEELEAGDFVFYDTNPSIPVEQRYYSRYTAEQFHKTFKIINI